LRVEAVDSGAPFCVRQFGPVQTSFAGAAGTRQDVTRVTGKPVDGLCPKPLNSGLALNVLVSLFLRDTFVTFWTE
jgi:hypothetical protein